jgi:hypothetical protein
MNDRSLTIERRYRGPLHSANGGYAAGLLASALGGPAEVTLRLPPPLDTPLDVACDGERLLLRDGDALVAEARPGDPGLVPPPAPSFDALTGTDDGLPAGWGTRGFGECFSCGIRAEGDGLGIHPRPWDGIVAARWTARDVSPGVVWAAIDCSGAYAVGGPDRGEPLLARMTARIDRLPAVGEPCVVIGWPLGEDRRKLHAGTALVGAGGEVLAVSRQLWITPLGF